MKIVDQRKDLFRRRPDADRAPDAERARLDRGKDENNRSGECKHNGDDGNDLKHGMLRIGKMLAGQVSAAGVSTYANYGYATRPRPTPSIRDKIRTGCG